MSSPPSQTSKSLQPNLFHPRPDRARAQPPDISVIITALNAEAYLEEAVTSIFKQRTTATWEILLVDDGSTDRTHAVASRLAASSPQPIRLLRHPGGVNCGISASRNLALKHARAPITAFLDADDVWLPDRLAHQLPHLVGRPSVAMVYAQAERWHDFHLPYAPATGSLGENFTPALLPVGELAGLVPSPRLLEWFLADESMTPCTCTVLVRTRIARQLGGFVHSFTGIYDDQVFYAKLALDYPIFVSEEVVARYRQHSASCCATARRDDRGDHGRELFLGWLARYRLSRPVAPSIDAHAPVALETLSAS